jgi:hypothetical protein
MLMLYLNNVTIYRHVQKLETNFVQKQIYLSYNS